MRTKKEFRNKKRDDFESWREMYMRCLDEREAKLRAITANIKQSQDKSKPIPTTKLVYTDSVVKPPRTIAKIQAKNGILFDKKPAHNSASRVAALALSEGAKKVVTLKSKKPPLMAKTLSFLKKWNRR
ncbi:hypothetical protein NQ314_002211 [Rhamnusium bicolor]|uniref:Uncharacterized protein n=1 Tax=Rhamnusium bicolor TaxID=1586634 RepID=A0AAV8ZS16_9CUCU|nr:hypothetical protein NQ314_002211 [Rhamnusium bicolor]